jgi:hypothetical protein
MLCCCVSLPNHIHLSTFSRNTLSNINMTEVKDETAIKADVKDETQNKVEVNGETIKAVAERLRFFFSDANIRVDRFMQNSLTKANGELSGSVPIETLLKFNSIKTHTEDPSVIVEATKTLADDLKLEDDDTCISRVKPFKLADMDANIPLSLFVSNLPVSEVEKGKPRYAVTVDAVKELFATYGECALVKFKYKPADGQDNEEGNDKYKAPDKRKKVFIPTGTAQIEFAKMEYLEKAAAELCPTKDGETTNAAKTTLELGGNTLEVILLKEYIGQRKKEKKGKKDTPDTNGEANSKKRKADDKPAVEIKEFKIDWKPGCVISIKGLSASCDREAIKDAVAKGLNTDDKELLDKGIYADYSRGQTQGAIRFSEPNDNIKELAEKMAKGEIEIAGTKLESAAVLEGEEEAKYWQAFIEFKNKQITQDKSKNGRKKSRDRR